MNLNHLGTIKLETERLTLRRIEIDDAEEMFNNWASDPEVTKYLPWKHHENVEVTKSIINLWLQSYNAGPSYQWGIVIKDTNELIGTIGVVHADESISCFEIGYCIGRNYWGKGYTQEALKEVIRFLFQNIGVNRIEARHNVENINSGKVMIKADMKYEGRLRERAFNNQGNLIDIDIYSILKKEYYR